MKTHNFIRAQLAFACLLFAAPVVARGGVYDDVSWWMRGTYNGTNPSSPYIAAWHQIVHALELGNPSINADAYAHVAPFGAGEEALHAITDVNSPYAGKTLKNRSVIRLAQTVKVSEETGDLVGRSTALLATNVLTGATTSNTNRYTVLLRYKMENKYSSSATESILIDYGWAYSQNSGFQLSIRGDDDNQYLHVYRGNTINSEIKATMNSADTRLSCGKWVDIAIVNDYNNFYVYTCAEGGRLCVQHIDVAPNASSVSRTDVNIGGHAFNSSSKTYTTAEFTAITAAMNQSFRGWIQQYAIWQRALSESEVKEAFMNGCGADDLIRFGVPNDSAYEFKGQGTETDADLATDWRNLPQSLTAASPTATIRFSVDALSFVGRRLSVKTTSASAVGCTLSATLNGNSLLSGAAAAPGATITADVPAADLVAGSNELVLTRTDGGDGDLEIDCLYIGDPVQSEYAYRGVPIRDDPYADAFGWWRHFVDADGDNAFDADTDYPNALMAKPALSGNARNIWTISAPASNYALEAQDVVEPVSGVVMSGEKCLYFKDSMWDSSGQDRYFGGAIYQQVFVVTNTDCYTMFGRFKVKEFPKSIVGAGTKATVAQLMGMACSWSDNTGVGAVLLNNLDAEDNLSLQIYTGTGSITLSGTQTGDSRNRLGVGKWIDVALVVSNSTLRAYTAVEGGTGVVCQGPVSINGGTALPERSWLSVGGKDRYGTSGAWGIPEYMRGWVHACAIWPRALSDDDVKLAMGWPSPDLARIGVANGTQDEFAGAAKTSFTTLANGDFVDATPSAISVGASYTVNFSVPADEVGKNQLFRLAALDGSDATVRIQLAINGTVVTNYTELAAPITSFLPDENGVYEIGVLRDTLLVEGANTLTVRGVGEFQGSGLVAIDALSLGNSGHRVKVRKGHGLIFVVK